MDEHESLPKQSVNRTGVNIKQNVIKFSKVLRSWPNITTTALL